MLQLPVCSRCPYTADAAVQLLPRRSRRSLVWQLAARMRHLGPIKVHAWLACFSPNTGLGSRAELRFARSSLPSRCSATLTATLVAEPAMLASPTVTPATPATAIDSNITRIANHATAATPTPTHSPLPPHCSNFTATPAEPHPGKTSIPATLDYTWPNHMLHQR